MNFFNYESGFMKFVTLLSRITVLNILWLCCCIPVITAGASTYAQYYSTKCLLNGDIHVFQNFKVDSDVNNATLAGCANKTIVVKAFAIQKDNLSLEQAIEQFPTGF